MKPTLMDIDKAANLRNSKVSTKEDDKKKDVKSPWDFLKKNMNKK